MYYFVVSKSSLPDKNPGLKDLQPFVTLSSRTIAHTGRRVVSIAHARSFGAFCFRSVTGIASAFQTAGVGRTFLSVGVRNGNVEGVRQ